jgi:hypothetical protein
MDISLSLTMTQIDRHQIIMKLIDRHITEEEARKQMGLGSVRQVRRIKKRVKEEGAKGVLHRSKGKQSNRKMPEELRSRIVSIIREKYPDFKPTFASEKLRENHGIEITSESLRRIMIKEKLWKPKPRKKPKDRRTWRPRKENPGEMQQYDGSYHKWFEDRGPETCLLLSVDDANGEITHAKFDEHEGVLPTFRFWKEYAEKNGLPVSVYLDKFSTYKINHPSAEDNNGLMTQFQRAMGDLGVKTISAHSPQAKGRVERMFGTLQDRLIKELRLRNISTVPEANRFLEEEFVPEYNRRFAVVPEKKTDLHRPLSKEMKKRLPHIFSVQQERKVQNDFTILFKGRFFQLEETQPTTVYKKDTVTVEEHLDDSLHISFKDHILNYRELPRRPRKQNIAVPAITRKKSGWKPPKNHPWKSPGHFSQKETSKVLANAP